MTLKIPIQFLPSPFRPPNPFPPTATARYMLLSASASPVTIRPGPALKYGAGAPHASCPMMGLTYWEPSLFLLTNSIPLHIDCYIVVL